MTFANVFVLQPQSFLEAVVDFDGLAVYVALHL